MNNLDRSAILDEIRTKYSLTMHELVELLKIPVHPRELRDEFAMTALAGLITTRPACSATIMKERARSAYQYADAMLEERK